MLDAPELSRRKAAFLGTDLLSDLTQAGGNMHHSGPAIGSNRSTDAEEEAQSNRDGVFEVAIYIDTTRCPATPDIYIALHWQENSSILVNSGTRITSTLSLIIPFRYWKYDTGYLGVFGLECKHGVRTKCREPSISPTK